MPTRHYFHDLTHIGRPSPAALQDQYGLQHLPITSRQSFEGWTEQNKANLPTTQWYDNAAATLAPVNGFVAIDHEDWPNTTKAERLATAEKFATVYTELKTRRPDLKFGFYGYAAKRDLSRSVVATNHVDYLAWQAENDDMAAMAAVVDMFLPSIYYFYTIATDGESAIAPAALYYQRNIEETRRLVMTYGDPDRPIYPYIWWRRHDNTGVLDTTTWEAMIDAAFAYADGCILWGGWEYLNPPTNTIAGFADWNAADPWWATFRSKLPKRVSAGHYARPTASAGQWK